MQPTAASIWLKPLADENTKQLQLKIGCKRAPGTDVIRAQQTRGREV